ncbi:DNA-binding response regulator [Duganella sp. BJB488]|uniref:response regulator transcription factor n=1 Tax=unclassified Duganella TaxID=2636909 RepID=UPI000E348794|nr:MULTISPECIES: response regulator transcription factor [unclassified Duganella]NVD73770.1 response regulator transcription factor [Duganella sp. BJB1802]RFP17805.1 DNA-binding response regulator [Duganella sp. BJB489]RFP22313.1 DNA-binding response regulator [Duganella sp. BJB488]RFP37647.1 DNA-binding response regulator [Duganella sp. BJB480]
MIRILIADDHAIVRGGLLQLFGLAGDMVVVAQATNGGQVMECLRTTPCDVVLLDLSMPGISGIELVARIRAHAPGLPILVLSMHNEALVVRRALKAGVNGYMTKDGDPETLLLALRKVAAGGRYLDPGLAEQMVFEGDGGQDEPAHEQLSNRELSIFRLFVRGKTVNQIADELSISNKTVSTHKARLMQKMGFQSNADMLRYGIDHGLGR